MEKMSRQERESIRERINRTGISPGVGSVHSLLDTIELLEQELREKKHEVERYHRFWEHE